MTESAGKLRLRALLRALLVLRGLPKTIAFNLRYLPLRQALRLPILVSHRVALLDLSGSVTITAPVRPGMILLGFGMVGTYDFRRARSVWQNAGEVVFCGPARLGNGFKLSSQGRVTFGADFVLTAESKISCREAITFGDGCLVSWEVMILDSDFHEITTSDGEVAKLQAPIVLGDRVWLGTRSTVLKGVTLGDDVIVAAGSLVTRSEPSDGVILGGHPAEVLRAGVRWTR
jgi:acetyltransferase-like isoleucine patch superfamily enzyme